MAYFIICILSSNHAASKTICRTCNVSSDDVAYVCSQLSYPECHGTFGCQGNLEHGIQRNEKPLTTEHAHSDNILILKYGIPTCRLSLIKPEKTC